MSSHAPVRWSCFSFIRDCTYDTASWAALEHNAWYGRLETGGNIQMIGGSPGGNKWWLGIQGPFSKNGGAY